MAKPYPKEDHLIGNYAPLRMESNVDDLQSDSASFSTRITNLKTDSGSFSTRVTNLKIDCI